MDVDASELVVVQSGAVLEIRLNRPAKRNALTREMLTQFREILLSIAPQIRVLVISAEGSVFCAGMDLQQMQAAANDPSASDIFQRDASLYRHVLQLLLQTGVPTVCLVQGPALAGGVGIVLACDLVVAVQGASLSLPEPQRGITAAIVAPLLRLRAGFSGAKKLLLSGMGMTSEEAERCGIFHWRVDAGQFASRRDDLLKSIQSGAPQAMAETKRQISAGVMEALSSEWNIAEQESALIRRSEEAREGLQAYLERRPPRWM